MKGPKSLTIKNEYGFAEFRIYKGRANYHLRKPEVHNNLKEYHKLMFDKKLSKFIEILGGKQWIKII